MAAHPVPPGSGGAGSGWQERLEEYCRSVGASSPDYEILSDRRGGRTAWSATVKVMSLQHTFSARFWYDGQYVNNAKEDAAEVAVKWYAQNAPQGGGSGGGSGPSGAGASGSGSGNGLNLRGGAGPAFSASSFLPNFASSTTQQQRANGYGVVWARSSRSY